MIFIQVRDLLRAIPGPVFSVSSYMGGIAMKDMGFSTAGYGMYYRFRRHFFTKRPTRTFLFPNLVEYEKICDCLPRIGGN